MENKIQFWSQSLVAVIFASFLLAPAIGYTHDCDPAPPLIEKRELTKLPGLFPLQQFPTTFAGYVRDNFGFRRTLINTHNRIKIGWLGKSTVSTIAIGPDDWLFLRQKQQLEDYRRTAIFSKEELAKWATALLGRRKFLAEKGIDYIFTVSPDKASIYPEKMPTWLRPGQGPSRLDQLRAYLEKETDIRILYPKAALLAQKHRGNIYYRTDSHWNCTGAYIGYQKIMNEVGNFLPDKAPHPLSDFLLTPVQHKGDLALALGLDLIGREDCIALGLKTDKQAKFHPDCVPPLTPNKRTYGALTVTYGPDGTTNRLLVFHDSFGERLVTNIAAHFAFSTFSWQRPKDPNEFRKYVYAVKPDLVIEQLVERNLHVIPDWD